MNGTRVGIRDVAAAAGVSVTTVSHALNGAGQLSQETRDRVKRVAGELHYRPNRLASGLRSQRSQIIGFVSDEISTTPYAGRVILGAQEAAAERGCVLMIVNTATDTRLENLEINALLQHQADGIIYARMYHQKLEVPDVLQGTRTVLLDAESDDLGLSSVVPDEVGAAYTAVTHLIGAGHRRIGYLANIDDIPASAGRLAGYRQALQDHGIALDESLILTGDATTPGGRAVATQILDRSDRPSALFCFNDRMGMGAYQAASLAGIQIPSELSIVSVDNFELVADALLPGLTSVELPHYEMGRWAIERLLAELETGTLPAEQIRMQCPLIERASVAPPPR